MKKYILILAFSILVFCFAWLIRFEIYPIYPARAYKLDRWTGTVTYLETDTEKLVEIWEKPVTYQEIVPPPPK